MQCRFCGRVRINGEWTRDPLVHVDVVGFCKTCGEWKARMARIQYARNARAVAQRQARGYGPAPEGEDVFRGFR